MTWKEEECKELVVTEGMEYPLTFWQPDLSFPRTIL